MRIGGGAAPAVSNDAAHDSADAADGSSTPTEGEEAADLLPTGVTAAHEDAVDSLNVSVTGAIILHHFLSTA